MTKIIFIGDSLTKATDSGGVTTAQSFADIIGLANGHTVVGNAGVSGDTSAGVLARLQTAVIDHQPNVCVVMVGINDWASAVTVKAYQHNVCEIFKRLKSNNIKVVGITTSLRRGTQSEYLSLQNYIMAFEAEARSLHIPVIDFYREMAAAYLYLPSIQFNALYVDSLHLSVAGNKFLACLAARPNFSGYFI